MGVSKTNHFPATPGVATFVTTRTTWGPFKRPSGYLATQLRPFQVPVTPTGPSLRAPPPPPPHRSPRPRLALAVLQGLGGAASVSQSFSVAERALASPPPHYAHAFGGRLQAEGAGARRLTPPGGPGHLPRTCLIPRVTGCGDVARKGGGGRFTPTAAAHVLSLDGLGD